ncbi:MAG: hypothetical protein D6776_00920 [Planctomycetota bacterium]|nr:MAG: hypothetical protein D6776_00920 [Planctomycetota bacterium]
MTADFHVHTEHSGDGYDSVAQTKDMARYAGLDVVALSDHDTLTQTTDPDFGSTATLTVLPAVEWTTRMHAGVVGASFLPPDELAQAGPPADWPAIVQDVIDRVHATGGAFIANHPADNRFPWVFDVRDVDAVEIWNSFWTVSDVGGKPSSPASIDDRMRSSGLTAAGIAPSAAIVAAAAAAGGGNDQALAYWEALLDRGERIAAVGSSDRHRWILPGYPCTWLRVRDNTPAEVIAALRAGRTLITASPHGPWVEFEADADGDGVFEAGIGDTVAAGSSVTLRVRVRGAARGLVRIVRRRATVHERRLSSGDVTFTLPVTLRPGDWVRLDVFEPVDGSLPAAAVVQSALGLLATPDIVAAFRAVGSVPPVIANAELYEMPRRYLPLFNVDVPGGLNFGRAAITSPIYAER